jgi:hypothetical protein
MADRRRQQREGTEPFQPPEGVESSSDAAQGAVQATTLGSSDDLPQGESYDSVDPEDARIEWLIRATDARPPIPNPDRRGHEAAAEGDIGVDATVPGFFESLEEEGAESKE